MNHTTSQFPGVQVSLTAHKDDNASLLLATVTASEVSNSSPRVPLQIALVIDRSGSMGGEKLEITKASVAQFIRTLDTQDRVAVITYDDKVNIFCGLEAPSEALARRVESIESGGSTDLYGGWVTGAKIVGRGGRVILLSDGQANVGRFTDARSLSLHASISYEKYGVTTTTIGVGTDYDEGVMAGMARTGGGAHYFAHTAVAISEAFSQERYSAGSVVIERLTLRCNGVTVQQGHFWSGEEKKSVFLVDQLKGLEFSIRYTERATNKRATHPIPCPTEFGFSEDARLELLLFRASEAEGEMLNVRDPKSASQMKDQLRAIVLEILSHPASDEPTVRAVVGRLRASIDRLEGLEKHYVEEDAMMHRKRSMQSSHNLRERAKGYSSFEDEAESVRMQAMHSAPSTSVKFELRFDLGAHKIAPLEMWIKWEALPVEFDGSTVVVAMEDPRRGFVLDEIQKVTRCKVKAVFADATAAEVVTILKTVTPVR
jgi:hypothetical protein